MGSTATGLANNDSDVDICIVMNEIDQKSAEEKDTKEPAVTDQLVCITSDIKDLENIKKEKTEVTEVSLIVDVDDIVSANDSFESVGISSAPNGKNDNSVPMLEKIKEVLKSYSKYCFTHFMNRKPNVFKHQTNFKSFSLFCCLDFVTKLQIILAKVPILKFNDRISGIEVTLNVNKLVSVRNTLLIHDYIKCKTKLLVLKECHIFTDKYLLPYI